MGDTVTYLGHINIVPSLNKAEYDYLYALTELFEHEAVPELPGQPGGACDWEPCVRGCCLSWNGGEKFHAGLVWMRYLIDHLLRPDTQAKSRHDARLRGFTFDHHLDGVIVGRQRYSRELFAIRVQHNDVSEEILVPGTPGPGETGWDGRYPDDLPWLAEGEPRWSSLDDPPPELADLKLVPPPVKSRASRSRAKNAKPLR